MGLSFGAVLRGVVVVLVLRLLARLAWLAFARSAGARPDWYLVLGAASAGATILGGFVAARSAGRAPILHGLIVGLLVAAWSSVTVVLGRFAPTWAWALTHGWCVALGTVGGFLASFVRAPEEPVTER